MTEHELEYLREKHAEAAAGVRERKAGHTAGPWQVGTRLVGSPKMGGELAVFGWPRWPGPPVVCLVAPPENISPEDEANAYLICAAPDLEAACRLAFEALDAATSTLAGLDPPAGSRLDDLCGELAAARDACAGALGRAEGLEKK